MLPMLGYAIMIIGLIWSITYNGYVLTKFTFSIEILVQNSTILPLITNANNISLNAN